MQALEATPVIDQLKLELDLVGDGADEAKRMLGIGDLDGCSGALMAAGVALERTSARRWALKLFAASRRAEVAIALEALAESLEAIEEQLTAASRACADRDLHVTAARVENAAGIALTATIQARMLAEGPLGTQIRVLALEGLLD
jgi:hypothetical protein